MIVKDEERFLERCLESIRDIADEIVIVDTGSRDRTKEIAMRHGARVFDLRWKDDFSAARNISLSHAVSNWILVLDADEMLDKDGKKELLRLINNRENCLKDVIGFKLDQRSYIPKTGDTQIPADPSQFSQAFDGHRSSMLVRLFRNSQKIRFRNKVHELVEHSIRENNGEIIDTSIVIHHFGHLKKDRLHSKEESYTDLIWKQLEQEPDSPRYNRQIANAFLEKGNTELALKYFIRTLKLNPNFPGLFADLGKAYLESGRTEKAIKFFNMAIAKDRRDVSSMNNLAVIYMGLGKIDVAQKLLEKALSIEPENKCLKENYSNLKKKL